MEWDLAPFLSGIGCGLCIGISLVALGNFYTAKRITPTTIKKFISASEYKLVLLVRTDLYMTKGKIAAQCSHAAVGAFETSKTLDPDGFKIWKHMGQAKVALKVGSLEEVNTLAQSAKESGLIVTKVHDDGRTQVPHSTLTVLGVGPAPKDEIDKITGHLKLL